jgi:hypothetical protein
MTMSERLELLDDYAATSRAFSDAVERLRHLNANAEAFIQALDDAGRAHRTCERSRIRLYKQMAQLTYAAPSEE